MSGSIPPRDGSPEIAVEQVAQRSGDLANNWLVTWRIANRTNEALAIDSAWLPHGEFRGDRVELSPALTIAPGQSVEIQLEVRWYAGPGSLVENAFLIVTAWWKEERWRVLARLTVRGTADGMPHATTETMTVQRVGFSEQHAP